MTAAPGKKMSLHQQVNEKTKHGLFIEWNTPAQKGTHKPDTQQARSVTSVIWLAWSCWASLVCSEEPECWVPREWAHTTEASGDGMLCPLVANYPSARICQRSRSFSLMAFHSITAHKFYLNQIKVTTLEDQHLD